VCLSSSTSSPQKQSVAVEKKMASSSSTEAETTTERRGIPGAQFVEDVETYLTQSGLDVNSSLSFLQERYSFISVS